MPPVVASPRSPPTSSNRPIIRATKRPRLSLKSPNLPRTNKRKHDEQPPTSVRKRRPSTAPTPPPAKRLRKVQDDIEMTDPQTPRSRRTKGTRRKTLKDVLRAHRIRNTVLDVPVTPFVPLQRFIPPAMDDDSDARTQCSQTEQVNTSVYLTGDEQVDVIDISEAAAIEQQAQHNDENPLQARLLEDGRCFVRIVRQDGTVDYYTLHPYQ